MPDYERMTAILRDAAMHELELLETIPAGIGFASRLKRTINEDIDVKKKYAILCGEISDGIDMLADIPFASAGVAALQQALFAAENIYIETSPYEITSSQDER